jgi:hypothetical protein
LLSSFQITSSCIKAMEVDPNENSPSRVVGVTGEV